MQDEVSALLRACQSSTALFIVVSNEVGLGLVERAPALKSMFIREAAGLTGEVPKLLRGEAL